ncbi:hypothetical protein EP47_01330 [Legionella norrlandica]|uniref:Uncharacterized protein n=1 Tax=Legionella norrlandica TaxID=1498499 RepID=A0A0A2SS64_9GAMM|nr:hypothetical protein [Legionella norrlandica]KGP62576.1 hypothetical protein EP47_01330 [Legionella norrlandica]
MNFFSQKQKGVLESLRLYNNEVRYILEELIGSSDWISYQDSDNNPVDIQIIELKKDHYCAVIHCEGLCAVDDKQLFIRNAVEFVIKQKKLPVSFENIAVGGLVGDEGRLGCLYRLIGQTPLPVHAYTAFKLPGENYVHIEDPRTGLFDRNEKLQSRTDDQICCFAASVLFYFCYKNLQKDNITKNTPKLFAEIYKNSELRALMQALENQVGYSVTTKKQVINSFIVQLLNFENPLIQDEEKRSTELQCTH